MNKVLLFLGFLLATPNWLLHAQKAEANQEIAEMKKRLIGEWKLVEGLPDEGDKKDRIWTFAKDDTLTDSKEDGKMHYFLVQNADGEIWMLLLSSLQDSSPMVTTIRIEGNTLKFQHVGRTPEGTYGAIPEGKLTLKRRKKAENGAAKR
jgi:hypothetical protein